MNTPAKVNRLSHQHRDDLPAVGDWFMVRTDDDDETPGLMIVAHIASNHVVFESDRYCTQRVRFRDLLRLTTPEPNWKRLLERKS